MVCMGKITAIVMISFVPAIALAQGNNMQQVSKGNELYRQQQYQAAANAYEKAIASDEKNATAHFNLGNALYKTKKVSESAGVFDKAATHAPNVDLKSRAYYNKGVSLTRQNQLVESIEAYKQSLRLNPKDEQARENLQKALNELKKQQQQQQKQDKQKNNKENKNDKPQQPKNNSKLNKKQVEQMLNALRQDEKQIQQNLQKRNNTMGANGKDW